MPNWIGNIKGRTTLGVGLTINDVEKLLRGELIFTPAEKLGLPFDLAVHYGKDGATLIEQMKLAGIEVNFSKGDDVGPDTKTD